MTDVQSLLFYIIAFTTSALLVGSGLKRRLRGLLLTGLIIPIVVAGIRYNVGTDFITYTNNMSWLQGVSVGDYLSDFSGYLEPTFYVFTQLAYLINYPQLIFFIYGTISIAFLYKAIRLSGINHAALIYFLLLVITFPMSFNMMRQYAAIAVATYATVLLFKGHRRKYILFTALASLLHISALVNILAYIVYRRTTDKKRYVISANKFIFGIAAILTTSLLVGYGLQKYSYLFNSPVVTANLNFIPRLLMFMTVLTLWYGSRATYKKYKLFIKLGALGISLGIIGFFIPYGDRISLYFFPLTIILLPTSIHSLMPDGKKHLMSFAVVSIGIVYFIASYYILGSHDIIPYKTILETTEI